jgi:hypothetical protein
MPRPAVDQQSLRPPATGTLAPPPQMLRNSVSAGKLKSGSSSPNLSPNSPVGGWNVSDRDEEGGVKGDPLGVLS